MRIDGPPGACELADMLALTSQADVLTPRAADRSLTRCRRLKPGYREMCPNSPVFSKPNRFAPDRCPTAWLRLQPTVMCGRTSPKSDQNLTRSSRQIAA